MKHSILFASLASTIVAAPITSGTFEWTPTLAGYFDVVFQYIQQAKAPGAPSPTCDLSRASMPIAPTPLPSPDGMILEHVAVGRGVQVCVSSFVDNIPMLTATELYMRQRHSYSRRSGSNRKVLQRLVRRS